jgi:hypothetical protein
MQPKLQITRLSTYTLFYNFNFITITTQTPSHSPNHLPSNNFLPNLHQPILRLRHHPFTLNSNPPLTQLTLHPCQPHPTTLRHKPSIPSFHQVHLLNLHHPFTNTTSAKRLPQPLLDRTFPQKLNSLPPQRRLAAFQAYDVQGRDDADFKAEARPRRAWA